MIDTTANVVIQVQLSADEAMSKLVALKQEVIKAKDEQISYTKSLEDLKAKGIESGATYDNIQKKIINVNAELKDLSNQQKIYQRVIDGNTTSLSAQDGSLVQLRAQLSALNALYSTFSDNQKGAGTVGEKVKLVIRSISDELKAQESSLGNNSRNVGNYAEAIATVVKSIDNQKGVLSSLNGQIDILSKNGLKNTQEFVALDAQIKKTNQTISFGTLTLLDQLNKQYEELTKNQGDGTQEAQTMKAQIDELTGTLASQTTAITEQGSSFESMKKRIHEAILAAEQMGEKFGNLSPQAMQAKQAVADLKDQVKKFQETVAILTPEGQLTSFLKIGSGITSAFAAAEGAAHLFGVESEDAAKALVKIQSAMALAQGIKGVAEAAKGMREFSSILGLVAPAQKAVAVGAEGMAAGEAAAATTTQALGVSMETLLGPVGLAIIAIMAVSSLLSDLDKNVDHIDSIKRSVDGENKAHERTVELLNNEAQLRTNEAAAALSEAQAKGAGVAEIEALEKNLLQSKKRLLTDETVENKTHLDKLFSLQQENLEKIRSSKKEDEIKKLKEIQDSQQNEIEAVQKRNQAIEIEEAKLPAETTAIEIEKENKLRSMRDETASLRIESMRSGQAKEIAAISESTRQTIERIKGDSAEEIALRSSLLEKQNTTISEIKQRYREKEASDEAALKFIQSEAGTEQRMMAEIDAIQRTTKIKLQNQNLSETDRRVLTATSNANILKIQDDYLAKVFEKDNKEIELKNRSTQALLRINLAKALAPAEKMAAEAQAIQQSTTDEIAAKQRAADEEIRITKATQQREIDAKKTTSEYIIASEEEKAKIIREIEDDKAKHISNVETALSNETAALYAEQLQKLKELNAQADKDRYDTTIRTNENILSDTSLSYDEQYQLELQNLEAKKSAEIAQAESSHQETYSIQLKYAALEKQLKDKVENDKLNTTKSMLNQSSALFAKHTLAYKVLASASASIDAYQAANAALQSASKIPYIGWILGPIAAAAAIVTGLSNVAKINNIDMGGASSYEGGGYTGKGHPSQVSTTLGRKPYTYHKDEYVVPSRVLSLSQAAPLVNQLEELRQWQYNTGSEGAKMILGHHFADQGGLVPLSNPLEGRVVTNITSGVTAEDVVSIVRETVSNMPPSYVAVRDINSEQASVAVVDGRANW